VAWKNKPVILYVVRLELIQTQHFGKISVIVCKGINEECHLLGCCAVYILCERRFTQDIHGPTSQETEFFIVTAVKT
jgi:hypothetical protein